MNTNFVTNTRITKELIIKGLSFIVECYSKGLPFSEITKGLQDMGCFFSINDVRRAFPNAKEKPLIEGLIEGDYMCAASVIANVMNPSNWEYASTMLLSNDEASPVYQFLGLTLATQNY